ncbi:dihydrofolate reductase family protein [Verrucosispora sp. NA02020]|nr:dihydrofolate reductase family protein [Verrucosispora sp. NA02020]
MPPSDDPAVEIVSGDPVAFVRDLKQRSGGDIWLCGGGQLAGQLLPEVDELVVKVNPIVVGSGIPLADRSFDLQHFSLVDATPIGAGVIMLHYTR